MTWLFSIFENLPVEVVFAFLFGFISYAALDRFSAYRLDREDLPDMPHIKNRRPVNHKSTLP